MYNVISFYLLIYITTGSTPQVVSSLHCVQGTINFGLPQTDDLTFYLVDSDLTFIKAGNLVIVLSERAHTNGFLFNLVLSLCPPTACLMKKVYGFQTIQLLNM